MKKECEIKYKATQCSGDDPVQGAPDRRARSVVPNLLWIGALIVAGSLSSGRAEAWPEHQFKLCSGYYALCAASTCTPTGKTITVNVSGGGTAKYPEAECTCPIESGQAIADVVGGNMGGSCKPAGEGQVWSLYDPKKEIPQAINGWVPSGPLAEAPLQTCSKDLNLGHQLVNCFSFACNNERYVNGVPVASCYCPIGEALDGTAVAPHTTFVTQAGQDDDGYCAEHPVGGPVSFPAIAQ
jgi:hypothetical protein